MNRYLDTKFEIKALDDEGTFTGYGSVFGVVDLGMDVVAPGAFKKSLKTRTPAMLWQHKQTEPIGVWTEAVEDDKGLLLTGKLEMQSEFGKRVHGLLKMGALDGLSIGFNVIKEAVDNSTGVHTLQKLDLWEVSPVTFPMNESARISDVKQIEDIMTIKDAEKFLREAGGFSRSEAVGILSRMKSVVQSESVDADELTRLLQLRGNVFQIQE